MKFYNLPVYEQKDRILKMLNHNQVVVVESPTGSGKTTQLPIILHEAGYTEKGVLGVTQPRRIAAVSVSEFIARQLNTTIPRTVGYKMRFDDQTDQTTKIKIMTDGILLQELKLDPWLSKYSIIIVDEAHERSLNIDFILGLLKRIIAERKDFKVIVSSATINTDLFALYFDDAPVIKIDALTYPVTLIFDQPKKPLRTSNSTWRADAETALFEKITDIVGRVMSDRYKGAVLIFLPGERAIKMCIEYLSKQPWFKRLYVLPLYGRLSREEQERVFDPPPFGKKKIVVSTNIAETSITINDISTVIDSGLAKLNFYNPRTYTSSLDETRVSKASCNQRRGRAGRTREGRCYRLYSRENFETRSLYTREEIYRTDLSEVVMRMSELGIYDFEDFDFISQPDKRDILGAIETLKMLDALETDNSLSKVGKMMCLFPLAPRQSRIIIEAILHYPASVEQVLICAAFLSTRTPFLFPPDEQIQARKAHTQFQDVHGDFLSFLKLFTSYLQAKRKSDFCKTYYLDERIMAEIENIKNQLELIVSDMGVPIINGGNYEDYLTCIARGMIQFVCIQDRRDSYRSITAEKIFIHPGSYMYKKNSPYIVAGEIVRTSRMYAMSVSPLSVKTVTMIAPELVDHHKIPIKNQIKKKNEKAAVKEKRNENTVMIFGKHYHIKKIKGKKHIDFDFHTLQSDLRQHTPPYDISHHIKSFKKMRGVIHINSSQILAGEKLSLMFKVVRIFDITPVDRNTIPLKQSFSMPDDKQKIIHQLPILFHSCIAKQKNSQLGFIALFTHSDNVFSLQVSRGFHTALHETFAAIQQLIDNQYSIFNDTEKEILNTVYTNMTLFFTDKNSHE